MLEVAADLARKVEMIEVQEMAQVSQELKDATARAQAILEGKPVPKQESPEFAVYLSRGELSERISMITPLLKLVRLCAKYGRNYRDVTMLEYFALVGMLVDENTAFQKLQK